MSEPQDLRESLARAVAEEPPLAFDPDALITRAQREVRRRRTLVAVGAATAMVALVAVIVPAAVGLVRGAGQVTAATSTPVLTTVASTPAPASTAAVPRSYTTGELVSTGNRFTTELLEIMPKAVPDASDVSIQGWTTGGDTFITPGPGRLDTLVRFQVKGTPTAIALSVRDAGAGLFATPQQSCAAAHLSGPDCVISTTSDGALVVERQAYADAQTISVIVYRPDGSTVSAAGYNYDPTSRAMVKFSTAPLVTSQQLFLLATQPGFTFG